MFCNHYNHCSLHTQCFSTATGYDWTGMCPQKFMVTVIVCLSAVKRVGNVTGGGKRKGIKADKCGDWKVKVSYMFLYSTMRSVLDKRAILPRIHTANGGGLYLLCPETHSLSLLFPFSHPSSPAILFISRNPSFHNHSVTLFLYGGIIDTFNESARSHSTKQW